jgi:hypothetical protein
MEKLSGEEMFEVFTTSVSVLFIIHGHGWTMRLTIARFQREWVRDWSTRVRDGRDANRQVIDGTMVQW